MGDIHVDYFGNRHTQKRRSCVWPVVDVLFQRAAFTRRPATISHQSNRINFHKQRDGASLIAGFRIKNVRSAKRKSKRLANDN